ncbi:MAG: (d)CMP kinase [Eubacteriales bacterium]|nr:(d)CMP kinase [Eubacteriales bacterium]
MIRIAIDGPSGAGKSSLAKGLAARLGINYLDTGALYRTVGYAAREAGISPDDREAVVRLLESISVEAVFENGTQMMYLNGRALGDEIRQHEISSYASAVSAIPEVRAFLLETQREVARRESVVMDGRDIGTVIMPDADIKIFLTASAEERAERRRRELAERGVVAEYPKILADIKERDRRDSERDIAPLRAAPDAILLDNSGFTPEMSTEAALRLICERSGDILPDGVCEACRTDGGKADGCR